MQNSVLLKKKKGYVSASRWNQQMFSLLEGDTMRLVCYDVNYFFFCSTLLLMKYKYCHGVHISEVKRWDK